MAICRLQVAAPRASDHDHPTGLRGGSHCEVANVVSRWQPSVYPKVGFGIRADAMNNRAMPNPVHDPKYTVFRDMLVAARLERNLMQSQVAEKLGRHQSFVSKYERGERRLDLPEFVEIAEVLELDVADFIVRYKALVEVLRTAR